MNTKHGTLNPEPGTINTEHRTLNTESQTMNQEPGTRNVQSGFSLVTAIFLIVVLAAIGGFIVTFFGLQQSSSSQEFQGARAYQAARAGVEWAAYQSLRSNSCAATTSLALTGSLSGLTATVQCTRTVHDEVGAPNDPITGTTDQVTVDQITATACNQPGPDCPPTTKAANYIERQIDATLAQP